MYVRDDHRGRGVGRLLVNAIESHARASFDALRLFTDNPVAASFYAALGYAVVNDSDRATHRKMLGRLKEPRRTSSE
jgi:GNAT superfamily N-acetyltransferase